MMVRVGLSADKDRNSGIHESTDNGIHSLNSLALANQEVGNKSEMFSLYKGKLI